MKAMNKERYVDLLRKGDFDMAAAFRPDYIDLLKLYHYVGQYAGGGAILCG